MGNSSAQDSDRLVESIADKIKQDLPQLLTREGSSKELFKLSKQGLYPSLTTYLLQEIERFNKVITIINKSIDELRAAIKGLAVMSDDLEIIYNNILMNKTPQQWEESTTRSLKPLSSWILNLCDKIEFVRSWLVNGRIHKFWMP